ncbi:hypothetical protein H4219_003677 [Mycoemilia scoparia]|uniref:Uncharacterized protein n=1 Tax=Mycoemilia scoparia TaxID=417184 RepID=A0A9W8A0K4_9FUNG|nr:hypothetical protein H4219_003677 [Mycoemilia scoparia]
MAIIRVERQTLDTSEGGEEEHRQQLGYRSIIDQVNEDVAIKAPKTALIPRKAGHSLIDRKSSLLDSRINLLNRQMGQQAYQHYTTTAIDRVSTIATQRSMPVQRPGPVYQQLRHSLTRERPALFHIHKDTIIRRQEQDYAQQYEIWQPQDIQIGQEQQPTISNRIKRFLSSTKQKISSWIVYPIETIKEARERYRIISPLLLRLLWVPLAPMVSFIVETVAFYIAAHDKAKIHKWVRDTADAIFFSQAIIQAYPFYTDTVIISTLKAARKALIFKYLYKPNRELIMESFGNDDDGKAQFRKATYTNVFSRESQEIPSARVRITRTKHSIKSMVSSNRGRVGAGAGTTQAESGTDTKKLPGEVERAFLDLWKFTAGIGGGDGRRQASLIPRFKNIKYRLKFYLVRYVLLTRGERQVYKMVFGPNRGNPRDHNN